MKSIVRLSRQWNIVCSEHAFFAAGMRLTYAGLKLLCCGVFMSGIFVTCVKAQDIPLVNPSLEDKPKDNKVPAGWLIAAETPDVQPGMYKVFVPPSDGKSYVGLHSGPGYEEGIAQELITEMRGGRSYSLSFDLAYYASYVYKGCYGNVSVYGGNAPGDRAELLWNSGVFNHTEWRRYSANLHPAGNYKYLSVYATVASLGCDSKYGVVALIDNFSPQLIEIPQISIAATNTCRDGNTGSITVKVTAGTGPFTYEWLPGGEGGNRLSDLAKGEYQVVVTAKNGMKVAAKVQIMESDLASAFKVTGSLCHGDNSNRLEILTTGGQPPYRYFLNDAVHGGHTPVFEGLPEGNYNVRVEDENGCSNLINAIPVSDPPELFLRGVVAKHTSCSDVEDGKIILTPAGGTPPYRYSIPSMNILQSDSVLGHLSAGYYHYVVSDSHGCTVEGQARIEMEMRDCAVYAPTAFSPNRDGINDVFRVKVHDAVTHFRLAVYSRWGNLIFETDNPEEGWNGSQKGIDLPAGTYLWMLTYTDSKARAVKQQGMLVLVR